MLPPPHKVFCLLPRDQEPVPTRLAHVFAERDERDCADLDPAAGTAPMQDHVREGGHGPCMGGPPHALGTLRRELRPQQSPLPAARRAVQRAQGVGATRDEENEGLTGTGVVHHHPQ
eukprot:1347193-Rhodomonas_salina.2